MAVAVQCFAEVRQPAQLTSQATALLAWLCEVFDRDAFQQPHLYHFTKTHVVPHVLAVGAQWPERARLAEILSARVPCEYAFIYDRLFGSTIGAVGSGDPVIYGRVLDYAQHDRPEFRVLAPFALATGWPGEETYERLLSLALQDPHPTVRYAAIYALGEHYGSRQRVLELVRDKLVNGKHGFDRASAVTAFARIAPLPGEALDVFGARLLDEPEKYPRTVIVRALGERFPNEERARILLARTARHDESPSPSDVETQDAWYPRQGALHSLIHLWPRHADTIAVLEERAANDSTPWLAKWCRATLDLRSRQNLVTAHDAGAH